MRTPLLLLALMVCATLGLAVYRIAQLIDGGRPSAPFTEEQRMPHAGAYFLRQAQLVANPVLHIDISPVSVFAPPVCGVTIPCVMNPGFNPLISKGKGNGYAQ